MANADNGNQSNPLAIVGNQQQRATNVPGASSAQGTVSLSLDDDGIQSIMDAFESKRGLQDGNCPPMASADNNQSNPLAFAGYQQQQIAASHMQNQQHGMMSSGSDNDGLWSIVAAFDNKRGHQDGQSSSVANLNKRNRLNPLYFNGNQLQQMGSSHMVSSNALPMEKHSRATAVNWGSCSASYSDKIIITSTKVRGIFQWTERNAI